MSIPGKGLNETIYTHARARARRVTVSRQLLSLWNLLTSTKIVSVRVRVRVLVCVCAAAAATVRGSGVMTNLESIK